MSFLVASYPSDSRRDDSYRAYLAYLESVKDRLPRTVYEFATADWHYDFTKPSCPHDAWIQEIKIREIAEGERHEIRKTQIEVVLLGACHDRLLKLTYKNVAAHSLNSSQSQIGYGDWLIDEISLSPMGLITHEVKFSTQAYFRIECADIIFEERPTSQPYLAVWE